MWICLKNENIQLISMKYNESLSNCETLICWTHGFENNIKNQYLSIFMKSSSNVPQQFQPQRLIGFAQMESSTLGKVVTTVDDSQILRSPQLGLVVYPFIPPWMMMYEVFLHIPNVHRGISFQHQQVRLDRRKQSMIVYKCTPP